MIEVPLKLSIQREEAAWSKNTMNNVVFVMTNSKLTNKNKIRKVIECIINDIESDDEWIMVDNNQGSLGGDILNFTIENGDLEVCNQNDGENETDDRDDLEIHNLEDEDDEGDVDDLDVGLTKDSLSDLLNLSLWLCYILVYV